MAVLHYQLQVDISDYPYQLTTNSEASNVPMEARNYTVEQLLEATLVSSANSAAIALAEENCWLRKRFCRYDAGKTLGMGNPGCHCCQYDGLNNETLGDIFTQDLKKMRKISSVLMMSLSLLVTSSKIPTSFGNHEKPSSTFAGMTITSTNYMLEGMPAYRGGFDGLKTGTTDKAGESFVGTTVEKGMRVITVVLNADHQDNNPYARFTATSSLMDYISSTFTLRKIVQKGDAYQDSKAPVQDGKENMVTAVAKDDISLIERVRDQSSQTIQFTPDSKAIQHHLKLELWLDI